MLFRDKLVELLKLRGWTIQHLSKITGIPVNTLKTYTRPGSVRSPSAETGLAIARAFNVPVEWLFDQLADMPPLTKIASPPFVIRPWPPDPITWDQLQAAIVLFLLEKLFSLLLARRDHGGSWSDPFVYSLAEMAEQSVPIKVVSGVPEYVATDPEVLADLASQYYGDGGYADWIIDQLMSIYLDTNARGTLYARKLLSVRAGPVFEKLKASWKPKQS